MNEKQAFEVILQALEVANTGQKFTLKDSATIYAAVNVLGKRFSQVDDLQNGPGTDVSVDESVKVLKKTK